MVAEGRASTQDWMLEQLLDEGCPLIVTGEPEPRTELTNPGLPRVVNDQNPHGLGVRQILARTWPALLVVVSVAVAAWLRARRHRAQRAQRATTLPWRAPAALRLRIAARQSVPARTTDWVLVSAWMGIYCHRQYFPVIAGAGITGSNRHG